MPRAWRQGLALLLSFLLLAGLAPAPSRAMTLEEERKLGREAYDEVMAQVPMVKDPDCLAYLRRLGKRITDQLNDELFTYTFNIADDDEMNAFAIPGGYIFFFRGIITMLESEAELVGVLAHEIAHIHHRHLANRVERGTPLSIATMAGALAGMILAALGGGAAGQALMIGSIAGGAQTSLMFSRDDESQADFTGYKLMTNLGYPGQEMAASFGRIWRMERLLGGEGVPNYLRSHPASPERMERIEDMVRRGSSRPRPYDNGEFLRIKTRLVALYEPLEQAAATLARQRREKPNDPLPLYGQALLEMRRARYHSALALLRLAGERGWQGSPLLWREQGKCHLLLGDLAQASDLLNKTVSLRYDDSEALSLLARAQMQGEQLEPARQTLARLVELEPDNDQALYDLGLALGKMGRTGESSLYLGQAFAKRGNERTARFHLTKAVASLESQPELREKAERELKEVEESKERKDKKRLEDKRREEEDRRRDDDDRRGTTRPPWETGRP